MSLGRRVYPAWFQPQCLCDICARFDRLIEGLRAVPLDDVNARTTQARLALPKHPSGILSVLVPGACSSDRQPALTPRDGSVRWIPEQINLDDDGGGSQRLGCTRPAIGSRRGR